MPWFVPRRPGTNLPPTWIRYIVFLPSHVYELYARGGTVLCTFYYSTTNVDDQRR